MVPKPETIGDALGRPALEEEPLHLHVQQLCGGSSGPGGGSTHVFLVDFVDSVGDVLHVLFRAINSELKDR